MRNIEKGMVVGSYVPGWMYLFEVAEIIDDLVYPLAGSIKAAESGMGANFREDFPEPPKFFYISQCEIAAEGEALLIAYDKARGV